MRRARVLVVDDERDSREIVGRLLEARGHSAAAAGSAEEAGAMARAERFDLILLDHVLPAATGMQSLAAIKAAARAPVYLMSGCNDEETRMDAALLGADGFLPKPLDLARLEAVLAALPERG